MHADVYFEFITPVPEIDDDAQREELTQLQEMLGKRLLEDAKCLSINKQFQSDIEGLREAWGISTLPVTERLRLDVEEVVREYWRKLDVSRESNLKRDLRSLIEAHGLSLLRHWGLVLVAMFYGLTPEIVVNEWDRLASLAIKAFRRVIQTDDLMRPDRERSVLHLVIKWLWFYFTQTDQSLAIPEPIAKVVHQANFMSNWPEEYNDLNELAEYVQRTSMAAPVPALLIAVDEYTSLSDIRRAWPLVEQVRIAFLTDVRNDRGEWSTFFRDFELWELYQEYRDYDAVARAYHRRHPEKKLLPDDYVTSDVKDMVRQAVYRVGERCV